MACRRSLGVFLAVGALVVASVAVVLDQRGGPAAAQEVDLLTGKLALVDELTAATTDTTDTDGDSIPDSVERVVGLVPDLADSDGDGLADDVELDAGIDPTNPDSNDDGLTDDFEMAAPSDPDDDGLANVVDRDDDGDGVTDRLDSSPYSASPATGSVTIDVAADDDPVVVDIAVRPAVADRMRYAGARWDWPSDDAGQMQDLDASREDILVTPTLEVTAATGPSAEQMAEYGITVLDANIWAGQPDGSWKAQISLVPLKETDETQGFTGRLYLPPGVDPGTITARFAWRVTGTTDYPSPTVLLDDGSDDGHALPGGLPVGSIVTAIDIDEEGRMADGSKRVSCFVGASSPGRLECDDRLKGAGSFGADDGYSVYLPGATPWISGTIDETVFEDPVMEQPAKRILVDNDRDFTNVSPGSLVTLTSQNNRTCFVERVEKHRLTCQDPGLGPGYSFLAGHTYTIKMQTSAGSQVLASGRASDTEYEHAPVNLARYHEDFVVTGMEARASRGTEALALGAPDAELALALGAALDVEFGQTQASPAEALATIATDYPPVGTLSAVGTYPSMDDAQIGAARDLVPEVLDGAVYGPDDAVPAFIAFEDRAVNAVPSEWDPDSPAPVPDTTAFTLDLAGEPEVVSKTVKLNWYTEPDDAEPGDLHLTDAVVALDEIDGWGLTDDEEAKVATLALNWMNGISTVTDVGGTVIPPSRLYPVAVRSGLETVFTAESVARQIALIVADGMISTQFLSELKGTAWLKSVKAITSSKWLIPDKAVNLVVTGMSKTRAAAEVVGLLNKVKNVPALAKIAAKATKWGKAFKVAGRVAGVVGAIVDVGFAVATMVGYIQDVGGWEGVLRGTLAALPDLLAAALGLVAVFAASGAGVFVAIALLVVLAILQWGWGEEIAAVFQGLGDLILGTDNWHHRTNVGFLPETIGAPQFVYEDFDDNDLDIGDKVMLVGPFATRTWTDPAGFDATLEALRATTVDPGMEVCWDYDTVAEDCRSGWTFPGHPNPMEYNPIYTPPTAQSATGSCDVELNRLEDEEGQEFDPRQCSITRVWKVVGDVRLDTAGPDRSYASRVTYDATINAWFCEHWGGIFGCTDLDGWKDRWRTQSGTSPWAPFALDVMPQRLDEFPSQFPTPSVVQDIDRDRDGLTDEQESDAGTNPAVADSDDDGLDDGFEVDYGGVSGPIEPLDDDTDDDDLLDGDEVGLGTDPRLADTDDDGLSDAEEVAGWDVVFHLGGARFEAAVTSNPMADDVDGDGIGDADERAAGTDPNVSEITSASCDDMQPTGTTGTVGNDRLTGSGGDDTITLGLLSGTDRVCGFGGDDTLVVSGTASADSFVLSGTTLIRGTHSVTFEGIDRIDLSGGAGTDVLRVTGTAEADLLELRGSDVLGLPTIATVHTVERVELAGGEGGDQFTVTPSASVAVDVDGGAGTDKVAYVEGTLDHVVDWGSAFTATGRERVRYTGTEWRARLATAGATPDWYDDPVTSFNHLCRSFNVAVNGTYTPLVGDFDGSGVPDVVWYAPGAAADSMWVDVGMTGGNLSIKAKKSLSLGGTYRPAVGDLDLDGRDDIFWHAPGTATDTVWFGTATGFTSRSASVNGTYTPIITRAGDRAAIFWYAPGTGPESMWVSQPGRTFKSVPAPQVNGTYRPVAMADAGGDPGILWYAPGAGTDTVWSGFSRAGGMPAIRQSVTIGITAQPVPQSPGVLLYAPGSAADQGIGFDLFGAGFSTIPASISGTYRVGAGPDAGLIVWHAPGAAADSLWVLHR